MQLGHLGDRRGGALPEGAAVLLGGLTVGAESRRPGGGDQCVGPRGLRLPGGLGVEGHAGRLGVMVLQPREDLPVEHAPAERRDLVEDGQPRQLVTEHHRVAGQDEDATLQGLVQRVSQLGGKVLDERHLAPWACQGDEVECLPSR